MGEVGQKRVFPEVILHHWEQKWVKLVKNAFFQK